MHCHFEMLVLECRLMQMLELPSEILHLRLNEVVHKDSITLSPKMRLVGSSFF